MKAKKVIAAFLATIVISAMKTAGGAVSTGELENLLSNFKEIRTYENTFSDANGHWAEEYIADAYEYGIINGIADDIYAPEGSLTVAQAITIAVRLHMPYRYSDAAQSVLEGYGAATVPEHWASQYVSYALGEGLIDDEWGSVLDKALTRTESIRIWSRILRPEDMPGINIVNSLPDIGISNPNHAEISLFYEAGIVQGSTINGMENSFNPNGTLSRAEAAAICMMMVNADKRISGRTYGEKTTSVFAGTGTSGFSDKAAATASFTLPYGLTADNKGRIIVFDTYNNAIRIIDNGQVETLGGQWIESDSGHFSRGFYRDGLLSESLFNRPVDGVYNTDGDLYVCDSENHVIRLIRGGRTYTFAGTTAGYRDDTGSSAKFDTPTAIAIDKGGNLYVADTMNECIRKVDTDGNVTTVAGIPGKSGYLNGNSSEALFRNPSGIAVNESGSVIYVADTGNHRIRKIEDGKVTTLSGVTAETDEDNEPLGSYRDGAAGNAMFNLPKGITLAEDILFVADSGNNAIRAVNMQGQAFTAAGTGKPGDREGGILTAEFNQPSGVLYCEGVLYIADTSNNMIKMLTIDTGIFEEAE